MTSLLAHIEALLVRDLRGVKKEIEAFENESQVWAIVPGITNPGGTLALHGCGNLRHYIGHVLGGLAYIRDRNNEFANRTATRSEISSEIDRTIEALQTTLRNLDPSTLESVYPERVGGFELNTQQFLLHLCTHLSFHLGQMGYLRRVVSGKDQSTGPVSLAALVN